LSTLTKIFVVVLTLLCIFFTSSVISFVAKTNDWRDLANDYRTQHQVVENHMRNQAAAHAAEKTAWIDARSALEDRVAKLQSTEAELLGQLADVRDQLARVQTEKQSCDALASRVASELQVAQNGWLEQRKQRESLEKRNMELERRNRDLSDRVNEQTAQILVLIQERKQLEQQLNILREQTRGMARADGTGLVRDAMGVVTETGAEPLASPATTTIRGEIVDLEGNLATISVGSADGVEPGLVFVIFRGEEYVGDMKVTDVEPNLAAGRIIRSRSAVQVSDSVADEQGFAQMP